MVVWNKTGSEWTPSQLFLSQHKGYQRVDWSQIESTFQADDAKKPRGGCDGQKNLDHPKVRTGIFMSTALMCSHYVLPRVERGMSLKK